MALLGQFEVGMWIGSYAWCDQDHFAIINLVLSLTSRTSSVQSEVGREDLKNLALSHHDNRHPDRYGLAS
jgi:hypothetical protein